METDDRAPSPEQLDRLAITFKHMRIEFNEGQFREAGKVALANRKQDLAPYIKQLQDTNDLLLARTALIPPLFKRLRDLLVQHRIKIPKDLDESIKAFEDNL